MRAQPAGRCARMHRTARHALAGHGFQQPPLAKRDDTAHADEGQEEWDADDQYREACGQRQAGDHEREVENAGGERQQHIKERGVGAHVHEDAEEAAQAARVRAGRCRRRGLQGRFHLDLGVAVGGGHFVGRPVSARNQLEHVGLGLARMGGDLGAQVLLGVVECVLDQCRVLTCQGCAQLLEVFIDRTGCIGTHTSLPSIKRSTKPRVCRQMSLHWRSIARPSSVMR